MLWGIHGAKEVAPYSPHAVLGKIGIMFVSERIGKKDCSVDIQSASAISHYIRKLSIGHQSIQTAAEEKSLTWIEMPRSGEFSIWNDEVEIVREREREHIYSCVKPEIVRRSMPCIQNNYLQAGSRAALCILWN